MTIAGFGADNFLRFQEQCSLLGAPSHGCSHSMNPKVGSSVLRYVWRVYAPASLAPCTLYSKAPEHYLCLGALSAARSARDQQSSPAGRDRAWLKCLTSGTVAVVRSWTPTKNSTECLVLSCRSGLNRCTSLQHTCASQVSGETELWVLLTAQASPAWLAECLCIFRSCRKSQCLQSSLNPQLLGPATEEVRPAPAQQVSHHQNQSAMSILPNGGFTQQRPES